MPVSATWYDEAHTIVRIEIVDPWTMPQLSEAIQVSRQLMGSVTYKVDSIWDGSGTNGAPSSLLSHFMMKNEDSVISSNQGFVLVVVRGAFLQTFVGLTKRLLPRTTQNMHITNSLQAASEKLAILRSQSA